MEVMLEWKMDEEYGRYISRRCKAVAVRSGSPDDSADTLGKPKPENLRNLPWCLHYYCYINIYTEGWIIKLTFAYLFHLPTFKTVRVMRKAASISCIMT